MFKSITTAALLLSAGTAFAQQGQPGAHFIENWDLDGNGSVSAAEVTERRGIIFDMFDDDQNGALNADEYVNFDATRAEDMATNGGGQGHGQGGPLQMVNQGMMLAFNDADQNGEVSRDEFVGKSDAWFTMMDKNGDGTVTGDDFGRGL